MFVRLTTEDNKPILVNTNYIESAQTDGGYTAVSVGAKTFRVQESLDTLWIKEKPRISIDCSMTIIGVAFIAMMIVFIRTAFV